MPTRPAQYFRPQNLDEALQLLTQPGAAPLGGGTRLLAGDVTAPIMVDLQDCGLSTINLFDRHLIIGATRTLTAIQESDRITGAPHALLVEAIRRAGANTFRNAATLGGVIASREPQSELLALLLVLETSLLVLQDSDNMQEITLEDYLLAPERPAGLISEIIIPWEAGQGAMERVARTPADDPIVAVVGWQPADAPIRLAAVGIDERPIRLRTAEQTSDLDSMIVAAQNAVTHPGDFLGSNEYRSEMVGVLLRRVMQS